MLLSLPSVLLETIVLSIEELAHMPGTRDVSATGRAMINVGCAEGGTDA
jgi:hypothetical protein